MKKIIGLLLAVAAVLLLNGCQPTPETEAVTSKNDGALEAALETTADETEMADSAEAVTYTDSFTNTDGDISYQVELETPAADTALPVLRVRPKTITAECAEHVAEVLFGDADIYEYSELQTKAELEEKILSLRQSLAEMGGADELLESQIAECEEEYASAPETIEKSPCAWEFHPHDWYVSDPEWAIPVVNSQGMIGDSDSRYIVATSERDGLPYIYAVCNRDEDDYRIHSIACEIDGEKVDEDALYSAQVPTETEIAEAQTEAESMISAMDLGEWVIEFCEVEAIYSDPTVAAGYEIVVTACPVHNGVKVSHQAQMAMLDIDDAYASHYFYEEIVFTFAGGKLLRFEYTSPLEVTEVVNENVAILSFEEAMEICKDQLQMITLSANPYAMEQFFQYVMFYPVATMNVEIYQAELGLTRTRVKDNSTDFYLLPAYTFRASYTLYDQDGDLLLDSHNLWPAALEELLVVNAVDGSIINTELGY